MVISLDKTIQFAEVKTNSKSLPLDDSHILENIDFIVGEAARVCPKIARHETDNLKLI